MTGIPWHCSEQIATCMHMYKVHKPLRVIHTCTGTYMYMIPNKHSCKYTPAISNKYKLRVLLSVSLNLSHLIHACLTCSGVLSNLNNSPQKIIVLATLLWSLSMHMYIGTNYSTQHYFLSLCYHNKHTHTHTISIVTCTHNVQSC